MESMQQQIAEITSDLKQLKVPFDIRTAATTEAIARSGVKIIGSDTAAATMESDLKQLYKSQTKP